MPLRIEETFRDALAGQTGKTGRPLAGMWVCSGSPLVAELCAGSGLDWLLVDAEHSPNGLESILAQLQAIHGYPVHTLVRPPVNDTVLVKQYLDLGVQNLLIPMVNSAAEAEAAVAATRYPPQGVRGVGSALARAARWNRVPDYLARANETISVTVQIESDAAVAAVENILAVDGVDRQPGNRPESMRSTRTRPGTTWPTAPISSWWGPTSRSWRGVPKPSLRNTSSPATSRRLTTTPPPATDPSLLKDYFNDSYSCAAPCRFVGA